MNLPAGHNSHVALPSAAEYVPPRHDIGNVAPTAHAAPAGHSLHIAVLVRPDEFDHDPEGQGSGSELPAAVDNHPSGRQLPGVQRQPTAAQNRHTETTSEPSENTAAAFAEFWMAYPRKVGKPTAQRAYTRHVKDHAELMDGLAAWAAHWATLADEQYVPHPSTWLNRHGWLDQPPAPSPRGRAGTVQTTVDTARQVLEQLAADTQQVTQQLQARRLELEAGDQ